MGKMYTIFVNNVLFCTLSNEVICQIGDFNKNMTFPYNDVYVKCKTKIIM